MQLHQNSLVISTDSPSASRPAATHYIPAMRKPLEIPPQAAQDFLRDMRAFFSAAGQLRQDEIAARQVWSLKQHLPRGTKLRLADVKQLFLQMRDHV